MGARQPTLKEIGAACGLTPSTVSAVLRGDSRNVRFSAATAARVQTAARELKYRPNRLAQSLVSGRPMLAALALHAERLMPFSFYSYDNLRQAALSFHEHDYEMAFVPFADADEQLARLQRLVEGRLVGGIITNFIGADHARVMAYLRDCGLPVVILGLLPEAGLPCLYTDTAPVFRHLVAQAEARGHARVLVVAAAGAETPVPELYVQPAEGAPVPLPAVPPPGALYLATGRLVTARLLALGVPPSQVWTVEDARLPCAYRPLIHVPSQQVRRMALAVRLLAAWMAGGPRPPAAPIAVYPQVEEIEWIGAEPDAPDKEIPPWR